MSTERAAATPAVVDRTQPRPGIHLLAPRTGLLDACAAAALSRDVKTVMATRPWAVLVDLSRTAGATGSGLLTFLPAALAARRDGIELCLVAPVASAVLTTIDHAGLREAFQIYHDIRAALLAVGVTLQPT